jgi:flagellar basal-body rod modification protein FlgD
MSLASDIINTQQSRSSAESTVNKVADASQQLGRDDFLKLMLAQMKNQDPFKAMDPTAFLGQLAQFSTVSGIQDMQGSIGTLAEAMRSSQVLDGSTMVGRDVLVATDEATLGETGSVKGAVNVPEGTTRALLNIKDVSGALVRTVQLSATAGMNDFTWDGTTSLGERAEAGRYSVEIEATVDGANSSLETMLSDRVNSVTIDANKGLTLNTTNSGSRALSDVRRVM